MVSEKLRRKLNCVHFQSFYFIFYGGYISFLLYFPVYLKHIGFNAAQVGVISGVRPIFQSIATPILVLIGDRFQSRKLLFVMSSLVAIAKLVALFLLLKPEHQQCIVKTLVQTNDSWTVSEHSYIIHHMLSKRDIVMQGWSQFGKNQDDTTTKENLSINMSETQLSSLPKAPLQEPTFDWNDNAGNNRIVTMNKTVSSTENTGKNLTFSHNITNQESSALGNRNHSEIEYRITNDDSEIRKLFYSLLAVVLLCDIFDAAMFTLVDHSCIEHQGDSYGGTRLWGTLGWGLMSLIIALVLHKVQHEFCGQMVDTYHYVFIFAIVLFNISLLVGSHLDLDAKFKEIKTKNVHGTKSNFHYGLFLILFAYGGFCNGFLFTFVNWFIDSIGGNAGIMGIVASCRCVVDVVLFFLLKKIIDCFGHVPVIGVGVVGHIVVFYTFARITNPWLVIPLEVVHAIFYGLLVSTCSYFLDQSAPAGSNLRLQGILHSIYWSVGSGSGALFSGLHIDYNGFYETFLLFTFLTIAVAFIYLAVEILTFVIDIRMLDDQDKSLQLTKSSGSEADVSSEGMSSDE